MNKLIFPPFCDPTQSYPSLPILKGYLQSRGIEVEITDWNIEGHLELLKQLGYQHVIEIFQDREQFFQADRYQQARDGLQAFYQQLSRTAKNYQFSNNSHFDLRGPWNFKRLEKYCQKSASPFHHFYLRQMATWKDTHWLGLSCTFVSQLPEIFYLAQLAKKHFPDISIVLGGPAIAQAVEAMIGANESIDQLFDYTDILCFDEGEQALADLFGTNSVGTKDLASIPNIMYRAHGKIITNQRAKLAASAFALPNFDGFDLNHYLAPSPIILYNPSRGCYWNRCSFCHYGFNQVDGQGYREVSAQKAVDHLAALKSRYHVDHFYFSSDVLSPRFAREFSQLAIEMQLGVYWSTDLRVEENYSAELCQQLAKSGMLSVAFGIESGSDGLLQLMDKGITAKRISTINRHFAQAGIACCWMTFNYHPRETVDQAEETLQLIEKEQAHIALFIMGEYGLTVGSKIFRHPLDFSIKNISFHPEDQFKIYPYFEMESLPRLSIDSSNKIDRRLAKISRHFDLDSYPFKGAISTHHSFLYFKKFGSQVFKK